MIAHRLALLILLFVFVMGTMGPRVLWACHEYGGSFGGSECFRRGQGEREPTRDPEEGYRRRQERDEEERRREAAEEERRARQRAEEERRRLQEEAERQRREAEWRRIQENLKIIENRLDDASRRLPPYVPKFPPRPPLHEVERRARELDLRLAAAVPLHDIEISPPQTLHGIPTSSWAHWARTLERRDAIVTNKPLTIRVSANPTAKPYHDHAFTRLLTSVGKDKEGVTANTMVIEAEARRKGLDADFVKAIIWMETTHGWYDEYSAEPKTIRPMNVHAEFWRGLGVRREELQDPAVNVRVGTDILRELWNRTEAPTPENVASLYNDLGADRVTDYGKTVVHYYMTKPWQGRR